MRQSAATLAARLKIAQDEILGRRKENPYRAAAGRCGAERQIKCSSIEDGSRWGFGFKDILSPSAKNHSVAARFRAPLRACGSKV